MIFHHNFDIMSKNDQKSMKKAILGIYKIIKKCAPLKFMLNIDFVFYYFIKFEQYFFNILILVTFFIAYFNCMVEQKDKSLFWSFLQASWSKFIPSNFGLRLLFCATMFYCIKTDFTKFKVC